ncbi:MULTISPECIES: glycosyltransferase [Bacteria]|uniref:glycosyltransferase n=1 Tax=Bacteria TaxID=2 RepID=UPI003C7D909C
MTDRLRVGFWRTRLLAGSETFIRLQAKTLQQGTTDVDTFGFAPLRSSLASDRDLFPFRGYNFSRAMLRAFQITRRSRRLERLLRKRRPDVMHAHFALDAGLITPTLRRLGIPLVVSVYGYDVTRTASDPRQAEKEAARLREAFDYATTITANSAFMRESAIARGADPDKVEVVHLGVEMREDAVPSPQEERRGVLFVGRFTEKKGVDDLIEAMSLLPAELRDTELTVIGDGETRESLERRAREHGLNARFLGSQPHSVVQEEVARTMILAAPSKTASDGDSEGLPTIILEAAQMGVPVVSTYHSGIPEAVADGRTGMLVQEKDPKAFAAALAQLLSDPARAWSMGQQGRALIREEFDIGLCARRLETIYARAVGERR